MNIYGYTGNELSNNRRYSHQSINIKIWGVAAGFLISQYNI